MTKKKLPVHRVIEQRVPTASELASHQWTFLSNHAHVVVCLSGNPHLRVRDIAELVGITERGVQRVLAELEQSNIVEKFREGRRNHYRVNHAASLRHPLEQHTTVGELIELVAGRSNLVGPKRRTG
jgi:hypothetical protein